MTIKKQLLLFLLMLLPLSAMTQTYSAELTQKAQSGDATAQCNLGLCYYYGNGVSRDLYAAADWFRKAADQGNAHGQKWLGVCYQWGRGVPTSHAEAAFWYRKAADQGLASAQSNLGFCYQTGKGVAEDYAQAVYWYRKAADQGDALAQNWLGRCYEEGKGVKKNYAQAAYWYNKAAKSAANDNRFASSFSEDLAEIQKKRKNARIPTTPEPAPYISIESASTAPLSDEEVRFANALKNAKKGDVQSQYEVGNEYEIGYGVTKDEAQAAYWFRKAADQGHAEAQYRLGQCYSDGTGVTKDKAQAAYWYRKAADQGDTNGQFMLGLCYQIGKGVTQDYAQAAYWYKQAKSSPIAKERLAEVQEIRGNAPIPKSPAPAPKLAQNSQKATTPVAPTQPIQPTQIPNLSVVPNSIAFMDAAGANAVVAGKSSTINLQVKNTGKGAASNCQAKVTAKGSTQGITTQNVNVGIIAAGETKTIALPINAGMQTQDGQVEFAIQVDEPNGFGTDPCYLTVQTRAFEAPLVQITDYSLTGNAGTTLRKKQPFDLQLMLQNTKYGQADDVSVSIDIPQNVLLFDGSRQQSFAALKGGETKSLVYSLIVNNNYQGSTIPIKVHVKEKHGKYAEDRTINLTLDQQLASTKIDVKASQQQPKGQIHIASIGSDVDKEIPTTEVTQEKTFVVIIANEHYLTVDGVPFANRDGEMFKAYCRQTLGIPQDNIRLLKDATLNGMMHEIDWLRQVMETFNGQASAIVYYAGHGIPDEHSHNAFLLPADGYPSNMKSAYSLDELYRTLGNMPAQSVTVFLDACFSGTKRDDTMLAKARGVRIKAKSSTPQGKMVVFSAAQGDETAYPYQEQEHGMFTYFLLKKLKESNGDATLGELSDYVTQRVKERSIVKNSKSQTPTVNTSAALAGSWRTMKLR